MVCEYTRTAERDLRGILDYISIELAEPVTARRLARLIIGEIAKPQRDAGAVPPLR